MNSVWCILVQAIKWSNRLAVHPSNSSLIAHRTLHYLTLLSFTTLLFLTLQTVPILETVTVWKLLLHEFLVKLCTTWLVFGALALGLAQNTAFYLSGVATLSIETFAAKIGILVLFDLWRHHHLSVWIHFVIRKAWLHICKTPVRWRLVRWRWNLLVERIIKKMAAHLLFDVAILLCSLEHICDVMDHWLVPQWELLLLYHFLINDYPLLPHFLNIISHCTTEFALTLPIFNS